MPRKAGRQAFVEIKADPDLHEIPVAIWTTSKEQYDRIHCKKAGTDVCVTKPESYTQLVNIIKKLVSKYSSPENMADPT